MPIENNDESGSDDDAILDQCRKIAWPEKTTSKVAPFRYKVQTYRIIDIRSFLHISIIE